MATKPISVGSLKPGRYVVIDGAACVVKSIQSSRPGKHGHAKSRIEAVGVIDGVKRIIIKPGHDNMDSPIIEKETAQILSVSGDMANVMDIKTYETFDLVIPEELQGKIKDGQQVLYWEIMGSRMLKQIKGEQ